MRVRARVYRVVQHRGGEETVKRTDTHTDNVMPPQRIPLTKQVGRTVSWYSPGVAHVCSSGSIRPLLPIATR